MIKLLLPAVLAGVLWTPCAQAQETAAVPPKIEITKSAFGSKFRHQGRDLKSMDDLRSVLQTANDTKAVQMLDHSQAMAIGAGVLAGAGGFMIGWPLGQKLGGQEDMNTGLLAAGAGVTVLGLGIAIVAEGARVRAVERFNSVVDQKRPISIRLLPPVHRGEWVQVSLSF